MTAASAAAGAHARARAAATPVQRVRKIGYAVLGLQLAGFLAWSVIVCDRFALTYDFSIYHQAWYLIAHGDLNPYDSLQGFSFWRSHAEFIMWPLALLYWVWPHSVTLLWVQDLAMVGAELVAFTWICEIAASRGSARAAWFAATGLLLLAADPWVWQTVAWDFHSEQLIILLLTLIAWDTANGRRRAWAWTLPLLACGDVAGVWLAGIGLGMALAGRSARWRGAGLAGLGLAVTIAIALLHANMGSGKGLQEYAYLTGAVGSPLTLGALVKGMVTHPLLSARTIFAKRLNIWSNLGPTGIIGAAPVTLLPVTVVVLLANNLFPGELFSVPGFQGVPLYVLLPAGTIMVLTWLYQRHRKAAVALSAVIAAQALAWAAVWAPTVPRNWLRVSPGAAATLAAAAARIPAGAEVIASQGVSGRFSGRADVMAVMSPGQLPVHGDVWFVVAPLQGIETLSTASSMTLISELAGPLGATLVMHASGVWVFRWHPPAGTGTVTVPADLTPVAAWTAPGAAGRRVTAGPVSGWYVTNSGGAGYVSDGMAWQVPAGRYQASVVMSASAPVNVEVWDDTGPRPTLVARRTVPRTDGVQQVALSFTAPDFTNPGGYAGWGPFRIQPIVPPPGQRLEVRVWTPGGEQVSVYSADLAPVSGPGTAAGA